MSRIQGIQPRCADKGTRSGSEQRRPDKGMPAGGPDVPPLVQAAALELLGNGGQALKGLMGNGKPEGGCNNGQSRCPGKHFSGVAASQQDAATRQRHHRGQQPSAGGREHHGYQAQRQIAGRQ